MTMPEAENVKQKLEKAVKEKSKDGLKEIEVFIAPSTEHDFESFRKMWRNSTYVVALATYGHADMKVYVCDENFIANKEEFETFDEFTNRTGIEI
jgi:hypothetical protein